MTTQSDGPPSPRPPNAVLQNPREPTRIGKNSSRGAASTPFSGQKGNSTSGSVTSQGNASHAGPSSYSGSSSGDAFPRSYTVGDVPAPTSQYLQGPDHSALRRSANQRRRHGVAQQVNQPRAISYHPGASGTADQWQNFRSAGLIDDGNESQAANTSEAARRRASTSAYGSSNPNTSDIVLQGRSYRFQPHLDHHGAMSSPYTATSSSIRDSTALLAGMLLRNDEDMGRSPGTAGASRIEEQPEDEEALAKSLPRPPVHISGFKKSPDAESLQAHSPKLATYEGAQPPSNLSRAILRSNGNSPDDSPAQNADAEGATESYAIDDAEYDENTPLVSSERAGRRRRASRFSESTKRSAQRMKSSSRSRSPHAGHSAFSALSGPEGGQGNEEMDASAKNASSAYGYGALAQAAQARGDQRASVALQDEGDDEEETLAAAWAFVPRFFRPGRGEYPVRGGGLTDRSSRALTRARKLTWRDALEAGKEPLRLLPSVILGVLLNILDGVSYGLIIFPTSYGIFSQFGGDGVSMFFATCIISQLVYSLGGSIFKGGNGSMMIEVVPFYHILVTIIIDTLGEEQPEAIVATTMVAFALSSIFAGIVFLGLGYFRLGVLIGFFPRHILVGCIGGVGVFLIETGLEVSAQLKSEAGFQWDKETFQFFTQSWLMVAHWLPPFLLAVLLRLITARFHHPLIFPGYFLVIPIIFYAITKGGLRVSLSELQRADWVFDVGSASEAPFWRFYTYFNFSKTSLPALWATMPTQLALTFFSILHVPLNVPALAVSVSEDNLDTDRELLAHGISNILAGLAGSVPNYLCYVNSVLFYRVGGGSRLSGLMLAAGTTIIFLAGPGSIGYLPIMVVGALIFVLGIDLFKEAVWDTIGRVNAWEYFTIWLIIFVMTYYDFVVGILSGIVVACLFFVIQTSRRRTVRAVLDGSVARSTVRRHTAQRKFLSQVGQQTQIVKLQGFLYFATISSVEELIRRGLDIAQWQRNPIRFLIVDLSLVSGVDFSAAEAFTRVQRLLEAKNVLLIFCGLTPESDVGVALRSVDLWTGFDMQLEVFQNLNEALEWTENEYLRSMYLSGLASAKPLRQGHRGALDMPSMKKSPSIHLNDDGVINSPRKQHLYNAAQEASKTSMGFSRLADEVDADSTQDTIQAKELTDESRIGNRRLSNLGNGEAKIARHPHPYSLLVLTFQAWITERHDEAFFEMLVPYFHRVTLQSGDTLWTRGDMSDGFYVIESGILKARYDFPQEDYEINESMLAGTIAGELTFLSHAERNTTAFADLDCTLWKIDRASMTKLRDSSPEAYEKLTQLLVFAGTEEQEGLMSYLVSRLS